MSSLIVKVSKVYKIDKHPNADRLSIVTLDDENGWNCIVGLDQYKKGDLVVYVPPDCVIPQDIIEKYELSYLRNNGRTGTIKLRGYISQGLILDLPEGKWKHGDDVANALGITKYEQPEPKYSLKSGRVTSKKKLNPLFDKYTEVENIKNYTFVFGEDDFVVVTEKIHGCNARYANLPIAYSEHLSLMGKIKYFFNKVILKREHEFCYGSHNVQLQTSNSKKNFYGTDVWGKIAKKYDFANTIPENTILYGEIYGKGIQELDYGYEDIDFVLFDIKQNGVYLGWLDVEDIANEMGLKTVPVIYVGHYLPDNLKGWTEGNSLLFPKQIREGCVIKTVFTQNHYAIGRKILKSISAEYLSRKNRTEYK